MIHIKVIFPGAFDLDRVTYHQVRYSGSLRMAGAVFLKSTTLTVPNLNLLGLLAEYFHFSGFCASGGLNSSKFLL